MKVTVDKEDFVVKVEHDEVDHLLPCTGGWHYKNGKPTMLPASQFAIIQQGSRKGQPFKNCDFCRMKSRESVQKHDARTTPPEVHYSMLPKSNDAVETTPMFKWRVTIVKKTEVVVYARDFLDAGAEAGEGEIFKVERID